MPCKDGNALGMSNWTIGPERGLGGELDLGLEKDSNRGGGIVGAAKTRLFHQPHLSMQRIWCEYECGSLFLRGTVPTFYHKQLAQEAVADLDGVEQIINDIEVVW